MITSVKILLQQTAEKIEAISIMLLMAFSERPIILRNIRNAAVKRPKIIINEKLVDIRSKK